MGKKWLGLCIAGCFGIILSIGGMSSSYGGEGKKLKMEGTVFDLKSSSSIMVYGYVSNKKLHPVKDATVKLTTPDQKTEKTSTDNSGYYEFSLGDTGTYAVQASSSSLGNTKKAKFKVGKGEEENFIISLKFKK